MQPDPKSIRVHHVHAIDKPINQIDYKIEELKEYAGEQIDETNISQPLNGQVHSLSNRSFKREFATTSSSISKFTKH